MTRPVESKIISTRIARDWRDVYAFASPPEAFPKWASGLGEPLRHEGAVWVFEGDEGLVSVRFSDTHQSAADEPGR